jgi:hypothetical protein
MQPTDHFKSMAMKRRTFLMTPGAGSAAAILSFRFAGSSFEDAAAELIHKELNFLKLDPKGVMRFVNEFSKNKDATYRLQVKGYAILGIRSSRSGKVNQLVSSYLLSTDFFANGMDERSTVRYVGLYNPYTRPCAHPFSHVYYPGTAA